jgi:hypothetical protein
VSIIGLYTAYKEDAMLHGKKIVVLQNTDYHFETALSIYKSLEDAGAEVFIHQICKDRFGQAEFLDSLGMKKASPSDLREASCAFVISAYPNPQVKFENALPYGNDPAIRMFGNRIVYISHRFGSADDYKTNRSPVKTHNSLCLSPLSARVGVDHINLIDMPIKPARKPLGRPIDFVVQGHFELKNRSVPEWFLAMDDGSGRARFIFLGGFARPMLPSKIEGKDIVFLENQSESSFYETLNKRANFIATMIDGSIKKGTYVKERFSSNFNQAFAMEKPIICHEDFKNIYGVPGFYYNDENHQEVVEKLFSMTQKDYDSMVDEFAEAKKPRREHNNRILSVKVEAVCS